ncbi:hypothetical protein [Salipaludibacillus sp. CF4.18]|uniref:hypothetical protein n=1 Tax=Salipaludibacillus sp. CF4.18 TaxID=3373081 RepID=UPI003EE731B4
MLRISDFKLTGDVDRLTEHEQKRFISRLYEALDKAVYWNLKHLTRRFKYSTSAKELADGFNSELHGIEIALLILNIRVNYAELDHMNGKKIAEGILAKFESPLEQQA